MKKLRASWRGPNAGVAAPSPAPGRLARGQGARGKASVATSAPGRLLWTCSLGAHGWQRSGPQPYAYLMHAPIPGPSLHTRVCVYTPPHLHASPAAYTYPRGPHTGAAPSGQATSTQALEIFSGPAAGGHPRALAWTLGPIPGPGSDICHESTPQPCRLGAEREEDTVSSGWNTRSYE